MKSILQFMARRRFNYIDMMGLFLMFALVERGMYVLSGVVIVAALAASIVAETKAMG